MNGHAVPVKVLKEFGSALADQNGQHFSLKLRYIHLCLQDWTSLAAWSKFCWHTPLSPSGTGFLVAAVRVMPVPICLLQ